MKKDGESKEANKKKVAVMTRAIEPKAQQVLMWVQQRCSSQARGS